jgi:hypothetical protein
MKKTLTASLAVASIAGALAVTPAHAQRGVAAGVAAGLIGGAIVGSAIANSPPPPPPGYYGGPAPAYYDAPPPAGCFWQQRRYWDGYEWNYRPVRVCY